MRLGIAVILITLLLACSFAQSHPPKPGIDYVPDLVELMFTPSFNQTLHKSTDGIIHFPTGDFKLDAILQRYHVKELHPTFSFDPISRHDKYFWELGMDRFYYFRSALPLPQAFGKQNAIDIADEIRTCLSIETAYASPIYEGHNTPTDWQLYPSARHSTTMWGLDSMHCRQAWNYGKGSSSIIVATIDTGIDYLHPDLVGNIKVNDLEDINHDGRYTAADEDGIDNDGNGYTDDVIGFDFANNNAFWLPGVQNDDGEDYGPIDNNPMDINGHGTHVAGTIAVVTNNRNGVPAASYNVKMLAVRAGFNVRINNSSDYTSRFFHTDVAPAVQYCVNRGARILSMSYGGDFNPLGVTTTSLQTAIQYARSHECLPFASAGNENSGDTRYPAGLNGVIAVAACSTGNVRASFSNYNPYMCFIAPGVDILSTMKNNTYHPHDYEFMNGTSMSCPNTASVAALILSNKPEFTATQLLNHLYDTGTDPAPWNADMYRNRLGRIVDAYKAMITLRPISFSMMNTDTVKMVYGDTLDLSWIAQSDITSFRLEFDSNYPSGNWSTIIDNSPDYAYRWTSDYTPLSNARFRIVSTQWPSLGDTMKIPIMVSPSRQLPFIETWSTPSRFGVGWTAPYDRGSSWDRTDDWDGTMIGHHFYNLDTADYLWSPRLFSLYSTAITIQYDLGCFPYTSEVADTFRLVWSTDSLHTIHTAQYRTNDGTGEHALCVGSGGGPISAPSEYEHVEVQLPPDAAGNPSLFIGFYLSRQDDRYHSFSDFFLDNVKVYGYARVNSPTNLFVEGISSNYVTLNWQDHSSNEAGFIIERSSDSVNYDSIGHTMMNLARFVDTQVQAGQHYWYRVWAHNGDLRSIYSSSIEAITSPSQPGTPIVGNVSQTSVKLYFQNAATYPNSPETEYCIYTLDRTRPVAVQGWMQYDGTFNVSPEWLPLEQWNALEFRGLTCGGHYSFGMQARAHDIVSTMTPLVEIDMLGAASTPSTQNFNVMRSTPWDWTVRNSNHGTQWRGYVDTVANRGAIVYECYLDTGTAGTSQLWSNYYNLVTSIPAEVRFKWSYFNTSSGQNEQLHFGYSWDGWNVNELWSAQALGVGDNSLASGTGGSQYQPATWDTWREARIILPDQVQAADTLRFVFTGNSANMSNIYITDFQVLSTPPPEAPSNAVIDSVSQTAIRFHWHNNDPNATGFLLSYSLDGIAFSQFTEVPATDTSYLMTNLAPSNCYWFQVNSLLHTLPSPGNTQVLGYTLPATPQAPLVTMVRCSTLSITAQNSLPPENSYNTMYSIQDLYSGLYVDYPSGLLTTYQRRELLSNWLSIMVSGLQPGVGYWFVVKAYNAPGDTSDNSPPTVVYTNTPATLPFYSGFADPSFPPTNWSTQADQGEAVWQRLSGGNAGDGVVSYDCYHDGLPGRETYLWTPDVDLTTIDSCQLSFKWAYTPFLAAYNDSLQVIVQDQQWYYTELWLKWSNGIGENALSSGIGGSAQVPAPQSTWRQATIRIPDAVKAKGLVRFAFIAHNQTGAVIFIDDITVSSLDAPPEMPIGLQISYSLPAGTVTLSWQAVSGSIDGYKVYRNTTGYFSANSTYYLTQLPSTTTEYTESVTGHYYYRVTAYRGSASSSSNWLRTPTPTTGILNRAPVMKLNQFRK